MAEPLSFVNPPEWPRPRGYANGVLTAGEGERILYVAGMVGWRAVPDSPEGVFDTSDLGEHFAVALDNVLAVVRAAGGLPSHVARMTVYVTNLDEYRKATPAIGKAWRERLGRHYPAMALVCVAGLLEEGAKVEIEATCVLPKAP